MMKYPLLSGIYLPFKIFHKAKIKIRSDCRLRLGSRVTLGNPDKEAARVSALPINIYFGRHSAVDVGHSVSIGPGVSIVVKNNANLSIGDSTYFTSDLHLEVVSNVVIGSNCAISWGVTIIDDDHHEVIYEDGQGKKETGSLNIGDHVWIGCNVTVLKGTQIGDHCIIGAGSVVKGVFPPNSLIAGNPAKVIRQNITWK